MPETIIRPIRIAFVVQNLNFGGMERVLHSLTSQLAASGFEVHLVILDYLGHFASGLERHAVFHRLTTPPSGLSILNPMELASVLRAIEPNIVHSHGGIWFQTARAARMANVKVIVHTEHGRPVSPPLVDRLLDRLASRWTQAIIAVSEPLSALLRTQVVAVPDRVRVIPNGIAPLIRGSRAAVRAELGIPESSIVIGSVGRLEPIKHYDLLIKAFAHTDARSWLVLVGDGSERGALEALARRLGVEARVRILGWRGDAQRLYSAFDLFALSSLSEGTSISLLEAMSSGICPVVTDVGGNRDVLGIALSHLLTPSNDEGRLATLLDQLIRDPDRRRAFGQEAERQVRRSYSLEAMVVRHMDLYSELAGLPLDASHEPAPRSNEISV